MVLVSGSILITDDGSVEVDIGDRIGSKSVDSVCKFERWGS